MCEARNFGAELAAAEAAKQRAAAELAGASDLIAPLTGGERGERRCGA